MWTVKDCFVGSECWCGIVVSPDGEECNSYGEISRADCQYIIDAINRTPGAEKNENEAHPTPWHAKFYSRHGDPCIVTTAGLASDRTEDGVGFVHRGNEEMFVEAVNEFYSRISR